MSEFSPEDIALGTRFRRRNRARRFWRGFGAVILAVAVIGGVYLATNQSQFVPPGDPVAQPSATTTFTIPAKAREATVDYVHDGDTLFIDLDGERLKVRLIGIDTPEVGDNLECYGNEATEVARTLMPEGSTVWVLTDGGTHDKYGRSLFYLFTDAGLLVNVELVSRGAAETLLISNNDRYWPQLEAAESAARDAGRGVWGGCY